MKEQRAARALMLVTLCAIYCLAAFPFAYFRHDDWILLGNAVQLPDHWSRVWNAQLDFGAGEVPWFFRPFFLLGAYLFFNVFGFQYWLWLSALLLVTIGAIWMAANAVLTISGSERKATLFTLLFVASIPLHFANLVWVGEGLMNCPLIALLAASTYLFCSGAAQKTQYPKATLTGGFLCFVMALGFKESAIFHNAWLLGLVLDPAFPKSIKRRKIELLLPYAIFTACYLLFRFLWLPMNGDYAPRSALSNILHPIEIFIGSLGLPLLIFFCWLMLLQRSSAKPFLRYLLTKKVYLPFLVVAILPHVAHQFFSPGWLLYPGFFLLLACCLNIPEECMPKQSLARLAPVLVILSLLPVAHHLNSVTWWQWHVTQRKLQRMIAEIDPDSVKELWIYDCQTAQHQRTLFQRVVALGAGHTAIVETLSPRQPGHPSHRQ